MPEARQVTTRREALKAGDDGLLVDGLLQATVERTSLTDLVTSLTTGKLRFQLTVLSTIPRAAVVVEERYARVDIVVSDRGRILAIVMDRVTRGPRPRRDVTSGRSRSTDQARSMARFGCTSDHGRHSRGPQSSAA